MGMTSRRSPIPLLLFVSLVLAGGFLGYVYTIGKESRIGAWTTSRVEKARVDVAGRLDSFRDRGESAPETLPYAPVMRERIESIFYEKEGFHFSQSRWGARPMPYQFRKLELVGPHPVALSAADRQAGIDERIHYGFSVEAYRVYDEDSGWGSCHDSGASVQYMMNRKQWSMDPGLSGERHAAPQGSLDFIG